MRFFPQLLIAFHQVEDASDMSAYINRIRESGAGNAAIDRGLEAQCDGRRPAAAFCVRLRHR